MISASLPPHFPYLGFARVCRLVLLLGVAGGVMSACVTTNVRSLKVSGSDFNSYLAREYQALAGMEQEGGDRDLSTHFARKAFAAAKAKPVARDIVDPNIIPVSLTPELDQAAMALDEALSIMRGIGNDNALAVAQVSFDCWVAQSAMRQDVLSVIATLPCRDQFRNAMQSLSGDVDQAAVRTAVYFDANSIVINEPARVVLMDLAMAMRHRPHWTLDLSGVTDTSGRKKANPSLSMRRAIAVRNALAQMGIDPDRIAVENEDHADTLLGDNDTETGDHAENRRVDIVATPSFGFTG